MASMNMMIGTEENDEVLGLWRRVENLPIQDEPVVTWFMDIDGVLNIIGRRPKTGWKVYAKASVYASDGLAWPVCYAPALIQLLNELHRKRIVDFRWLTTWEHDAAVRFAPAVGLKIGDQVAGVDRGQSQWWKWDVVSSYLPHPRLVIWTDDDIQHFASARTAIHWIQPDEGIVICPEETKGLTPHHFNDILLGIEGTLAH